MIYTILSENTSLAWTLGGIATALGIIGTLIKLYTNQRSAIRSQAIAENELQNELKQVKSDLGHTQKDLDKLEERFIADQKSIVEKITQIDERIEKKLDKLQSVLMELLKGD